MEPKIGDRVRATMNGEDWFTGVYVKESETLAQYGIRRDDMPDEIRFFTHAEKLAEAGMPGWNPNDVELKVQCLNITQGNLERAQGLFAWLRGTKEV